MNKRECIHVLDYFNNTLDDREREEFESHLLECMDCQEQLAELSLIDEDISAIDSSLQPPRGMKKRVLGAVFEQEKENQSASHNIETFNPVPKKDESPNRTAKSRKPLWTLVTAAALLISVGTNLYTSNQLSNLEQEFAQIEAERDELVTIIDRTQDEPTQSTESLLTYTSLVNETETTIGAASIVENEQGRQLVVQVSDLPALTDTSVYQVWLIRDGTPYPTGSFVTNQTGQGAVTYSLTKEEDLGEAIAISLESQPNNTAPEGDIVTISDL
ncbi:anti-sigma factor [Bacillus sp. FJAT-45037]|uniref:anti-sigma factor n=1 Tax=Bacillus sp. FJAT-45037 TaxID=2011007 RepID=UPI0018E23581|nr:anti-sigma factor [Bacillus sp. FJAT-45037]